jgi:hypothetical protein
MPLDILKQEFCFSDLFSNAEIMQNLIQNQLGIYACYFDNIPDLVPTDNCEVDYNSGLPLLYVGMTTNLVGRINNHCTGNAECSTLRWSLGCLLSEVLNIQLRRSGNNNIKRFARIGANNIDDGEQVLTNWIVNNARFSYRVLNDENEANELEVWLIGHLSLPLNIQHNNHVFSKFLSHLRKRDWHLAQELPTLF